MPVYKNATIGRVSNGAMPTIPFVVGDTVETLLDKADIELGEGEEVNDLNGNPISLDTEATEITYYVVRNMKNGM